MTPELSSAARAGRTAGASILADVPQDFSSPRTAFDAPFDDEPALDGAKLPLLAGLVVALALASVAGFLLRPSSSSSVAADAGGQGDVAANSPSDEGPQLMDSPELSSDDGANPLATGEPPESDIGGLLAAEMVLPAVPGTTTTTVASTTTEWVEPPLPPTSEWVDSGNGVLLPDVLLRIRFCESTNNYQAANSWSSARGAYQFLSKSWDWYGHAEITGVEAAHLATPAEQDAAALRTLERWGTGPWAESRPCWADPDLDERYATARPRTTTTVESSDSTSSTDTTEAAPSTTASDDSGQDNTGSTDTTQPTNSTAEGETTSTDTTWSDSSTTMDPSAGESSTSSTEPVASDPNS